MRLIGTALIVFSCGMMGLIVAGSYGKRVYNLRQLISFIQILESEIHFARTTLPDIISIQKNEYSGVIAEFLRILDDALQNEEGEEFSKVWAHGIINLGEEGFPSQVLGDMQELGRVLGINDVSEQTKHIKKTLIRLEQALQEAKSEQEKHTRLWQYMGFSAGLLIVLLLF
ncbi:MAG: stage III sporulation protein AB [Bacillota bacterium]|nr:stage III sporulation protein AB [Bacillota bacterium]HHU60423.1 hypothetical protein [Natronincola sp.]